VEEKLHPQFVRDTRCNPLPKLAHPAFAEGMSDPKNESPTDGEPDVQASNDGTAGVGEDPQGESTFDAETDA
jgi:hypothetical protein